MNEKWTDEQLRAINLMGKHILVSASAGSGKTSVMTERVLGLLSKGYTLEQMLIVTFTRAAAADMKEKLALKILNSTDLGVKNQFSLLSNADICTLHSFCQKLASQYFYTVGIDPEFGVLEDSSALLNRSIEEAIREFCKNPSADFSEVYDIYTDARSDFRLKNLILNMFFSAQTGQENVAPVNPMQSTMDLLDKRRDELIRRANRLRIETLQAGFRRNFEALEAFEGCLRGLVAPVCPRGRIEPQFIDLNLSFKQLKEQAESLIADYKRVGESKPQTDKYLRVLEQLTLRTQQIFERLKAEKSRLDFNDLEHIGLKIINSSAGNQIREKYKFIFVDEYQDINPIQNQIIESLKGDNYLFLVGDIKQSIYAFRGCEPDIFLAKRNQFLLDEDKEVIELNLNHRSDNEILDFANRLFCATMTSEFGGVDYKNNASFILGDKSGGRVSLCCAKGEQQGVDSYEKIYDITRHESASDPQADGVVQCILDILANEQVVENGVCRPVLYKDIAVLCRSMGQSAQQICLRLADYGIFAVLSQEQNEEDIYTGGLINYLKLIANPLDDEALINALKSFFGGFSDDELARVRLDFLEAEHFYEAAYSHYLMNDFFERVEYFRKLSGRVSVSELCGAIVSSFDYFQYLFIKGTYAVRRLERFLELAQGFEGTLDEFLLEGGLISLKESEPDAVSIMTIHASKGLEFPFVILLDVQKRFNLRDLYSPVLLYKGCAAIKHYDYQNQTQADSAEWLFNYFNMLKRRKEEELRLLYVAVTRAKHHLYIFSSEEFRCDNEYADPALAGSYLAWLSPFYSAFKGKELVAFEPIEKPKRVAPRPDERLVDALKEILEEKSAGGRRLIKSYVTALSEASLDESVAFSMFSHDDRAIERGVAYHKAMELVDFDKPFDFEGLDGWIKELVDREKLYCCFEAVKELINDAKYYKEKGFMLNSNNSLIQGIIDLMIIKEDFAIIVDYKTGHIHPSYQSQLDLYAKAVEQILGLRVEKKLVYSFLSQNFIEF